MTSHPLKRRTRFFIISLALFAFMLLKTSPNASALEYCGPSLDTSLKLTSMCSDYPDIYRVWRVRNENNCTANYTWDLVGKPDIGDGAAPAGSDVFFNTTTYAGPNTVKLLYNGVQQAVKASNPAACPDNTPPEIDPWEPANAALVQNREVLFSFSVEDRSGAASCSLILTRDETNITFTSTNISTSEINIMIIPSIDAGRISWSISCADTEGNTADTTSKTLTLFSSTGITITNLSEVSDPTAVENLSVEGSGGRIQFIEPIDVSGGPDLDSALSIKPKNITLDPGRLPEFNRRAWLYLFGLRYLFKPVLFKDSLQCLPPICNNISFFNSTLAFSVSGFSSYTADANSQLSTWDDTDREGISLEPKPGNIISFYANYTNTTSGMQIDPASCIITINGSSHSMTYHDIAGYYEHMQAFDAPGTYPYSIICNASSLGYEPLNISDSITVLSGPPAPQLKITSIRSSNMTDPSPLLNISIIGPDIDTVWFSLDGNRNITYATGSGTAEYARLSPLLVDSFGQYPDGSDASPTWTNPPLFAYAETINGTYALYNTTPIIDALSYASDFSHADYSMTAKVMVPSGYFGGAYLCPRYTDVNNKYEIALDFDWSSININKVEDGAWTSLGAVWTGSLPQPVFVTKDSWYELGFIIEGTNITATLDGQRALSVTDTSLNGTGLAIIAFDDTDTHKAYFDNISVWDSLRFGPHTITIYANTTNGTLVYEEKTFALTGDTTPPSATTIEAQAAPQSFSITFSTDDMTTAEVEYGASPSLGQILPKKPYASIHAITIDSLEQNTTYYYSATVCNYESMCAYSGISNITTPIPPLLLSLPPLTNESTQAPLTQDVNVSFSTPLDVSSITGDSFTVSSKENISVGGSLEYDNSSFLVRFNPYRHLPDNTTFTVTIDGIRGSGGESLSHPITWNFTTRVKDTDNDTIPDSDDTDDDGDLIPDTIDYLKGSLKDIKTELAGLWMTVNSSIELNRTFNNSLPVKFFSGPEMIISFDFPFGTRVLDLTNLTIEKNANNTHGSLIIAGLPGMIPKEFYIDNLTLSDGICVLDKDSDSIQDISADCKAEFETFVPCPGNASGYVCAINSTRLLLTGLMHSAAEQRNDNAPPRIELLSISYSGSSTITSSLTAITDESSSCRFGTSDTDYSSLQYSMTGSGQIHSGTKSYSSSSQGTYYVRCRDNFQNAMQYSAQVSYIASPSPSEDSVSLAASIAGGSGFSGGAASADNCAEVWTCTGWSPCQDGFQTRECIEQNGCMAHSEKPPIFQPCASGCEEIWHCADWSVCENELRTRSCTDLSSCGTELLKPSEFESCAYHPECYNLIQDAGEYAIDCGGMCPPCETCFDRIQNQREDGIDCGGPCRPCRSGDIVTTGKAILLSPDNAPGISAAAIVFIIAGIAFMVHRTRGSMLHSCNITHLRKRLEKNRIKTRQIKHRGQKR